MIIDFRVFDKKTNSLLYNKNELDETWFFQDDSWIIQLNTLEKDRNNKTIYIGDIVKITRESDNDFNVFTGIVVLNKLTDGCVIEFEKNYFELGLKKYNYEIIGNLCDTPELVVR